LGVDAYDNLHTAAKEALGAVEVSSNCAGRELFADYQVYVDGSALQDGTGKTAWALAALGVRKDGTEVLLDILGGYLEGEGSVPWSSRKPDCLAAEGAAMAWACTWAIAETARHSREDRPKVTFLYDNAAVGEAAEGRTSLMCDVELFRCATGLSYILDEVAVPMWQHTTSHTGIAWNELVDSVCRGVAKGELQLASVDSPDAAAMCFARSEQAQDWSWIFAAAANDPQAWPDVAGGKVSGTAPPNVSTVNPFYFRRVIAKKKAAPPIITVRAVTANVLTLDVGDESGKSKHRGDGEGGSLLDAGRTEFLERSFAASRFLFVGIQEARTNQQGMRRGSCYFAVKGGTAKSALGVELWVSHSVPYASGPEGDAFFAADDITLLAASPRLLLGRVNAKWFRADILVLHAPCEPKVGDEDAVADQRTFWEDVDRIIASRPSPQFPLLFLGDRNARVGCTPSDMIG